MSGRKWCEKCGREVIWEFGVVESHYIDGCNGRVIPIATLCSEPTVIDESDLAPGMVVVAVDDTTVSTATHSGAFLCSPDACLNWPDQPRLVIARTMTPCKMTDSAEEVRFIAKGFP